MKITRIGQGVISCFVGIAVAGCVMRPMVPTVNILPGRSTPFEAFVEQDQECTSYAMAVATAPQAVEDAAVSGVVGGLIGAGAGAIMGAGLGNAGTGAAIGGGLGALTGLAGGSQAGQHAAMNRQRQIDQRYRQCHYAKGNQVPGMWTMGR